MAFVARAQQAGKVYRIGIREAINVALAINGGVASASSTNPYMPGKPAALNDGEVLGADGYFGTRVWSNYPSEDYLAGKPWWASITFAGVKSIRSVVVYFMQYHWRFPLDPFANTWTTFASRSFDVQRWDGAAWVTIKHVDNPGPYPKTRCVVDFGEQISTDRVRVIVSDPRAEERAFIAEIEAWTEAAPTRPNEPAPVANAFKIGAQPYQSLLAAMAALKDGQTLDIVGQPGRLDCGYTAASNITINCNQFPLYQAFGGKAALVLGGKNVTVNAPRGLGIMNDSGNGGVIRFEGEHLTVNDLFADYCQMPYQSGLQHPNSVEIIRRAKVRRTCGDPISGRIGHGLYVGPCAKVSVIDYDFEGSALPQQGHGLKSYAVENIVSGGTIKEGASTSRCIDISRGGILTLSNGLRLVQGSASDNPDMIGFGGESYIGVDPVTGANIRGIIRVNRIDIDPSVAFESPNPAWDSYRIHAYVPVTVTGIDRKFCTIPTGTFPTNLPRGVPPVVR